MLFNGFLCDVFQVELALTYNCEVAQEKLLQYIHFNRHSNTLLIEHNAKLINELKTKTNQVKTEMDQVKTKTNQVKTEMDQVKTKTNQVKKEMNQVKTKTNQVKTEMNQMKTEIKDLHKSVVGHPITCELGHMRISCPSGMLIKNFGGQLWSSTSTSPHLPT